MISLAINVARSVGFRGAVRALQVFFQWLGVERAIPGRTSIRNWLQRLGIDEMKQPLDSSESLVIMVDHSNQIGPEKVMLALGVDAAALPEPGKALTHEHVRVLEVKPGDSWKTADMEREYEALADRHGTPRAVLVDGAVELREGAKCLKKRREDMLVLRDFKHYAANVVKSLIGNDERFKEVGGKIGSTRSSIQQTELAHLSPPSPKQKARFMNLSRHAGLADHDLVAVEESRGESTRRDSRRADAGEAGLGRGVCGGDCGLARVPGRGFGGGDIHQ